MHNISDKVFKTLPKDKQEDLVIDLINKSIDIEILTFQLNNLNDGLIYKNWKMMLEYYDATMKPISDKVDLSKVDDIIKFMQGTLFTHVPIINTQNNNALLTANFDILQKLFIITNHTLADLNYDGWWFVREEFLLKMVESNLNNNLSAMNFGKAVFNENGDCLDLALQFSYCIMSPFQDIDKSLNTDLLN